jgi:hypothetical protein
MLDYSRCALIRHVPDGYIVHHYGRKPDITVMIGHWTRHHKDEYPDIEARGLRLAPEWRPDGAGIQLSLFDLDTAPGDVV